MVGAANRVCRDHRHHKPRRAKSALRAVIGDHCGLHRMGGAIGGSQPFDGADRFAVQLRQEQDAGVQRAGTLSVCHHHGAGTAIAFVAAFFGAGQGAFLAQPIQQGLRRRHIRKANRRSVQVKRYIRHVNIRRGLCVLG